MASDCERLGFLAILVQKSLDFPSLIRPWSKARFPVLKLAGNQILGTLTRENENNFVNALEATLVEHSQSFYVEDLEVKSPIWDVIHTHFKRKPYRIVYPTAPQPHWWLEFPPEPQRYWEKFSHRTRNTLKRRLKKLEHKVTCYHSEDDVEKFLERAALVSTKTWQAKKLGLRIRNDVVEKELWRGIARLGAMRSYILEHGGVPIAFLLGIQWKKCFTPEEIGYDEEFSRFAPGTVLYYRVLEKLIENNTPRQIDFGFGENDYKRVFGTRSTVTGPVMVVRRRSRLSASLRLQEWRSGIQRFAKRHLQDSWIWRLLRQRRGRGTPKKEPCEEGE